MHDENDPPQLWRALAHYLDQVCALFGAPAALARRVWLTRREHGHLCDWLRPLEALVRRLLFIAAWKLDLAPAPVVETKQRAPLTMNATFGAAFDAENPQTWRTSFRCADRRLSSRNTWSAGAPAGETGAASHIHAGEGVGAPRGMLSAAPIALRFEALLRAFDNREDYALKLARKLARDHAMAYDMAVAPAKDKNPLWAPVRDAALWVCRTIAPPEPCADTS